MVPVAAVRKVVGEKGELLKNMVFRYLVEGFQSGRADLPLNNCAGPKRGRGFGLGRRVYGFCSPISNEGRRFR